MQFRREVKELGLRSKVWIKYYADRNNKLINSIEQLFTNQFQQKLLQSVVDIKIKGYLHMYFVETLIYAATYINSNLSSTYLIFYIWKCL